MVGRLKFKMWNEKELMRIKEISQNVPKSLCYRLHQVSFTDSTSESAEAINSDIGNYSIKCSENDELCSPSFDLFESSNPNFDSNLSIDAQGNNSCEILYWEQFNFVLEASSEELDSSNLKADLAGMVKIVDESRLDNDQCMDFWKEFLEKQTQDPNKLRKQAGFALLISYFSRECENITRQHFHNILSNDVFDIWNEVLYSLVLLDRFTDQHLLRHFLDLVDFQLLSDKFSSQQAGIILSSLTKVVDHWNENCLQILISVLKSVQKSVQNISDATTRESLMQLKVNAFEVSCLVEALLQLSNMENSSLPTSQHCFNLLNILIRCFPTVLKVTFYTSQR